MKKLVLSLAMVATVTFAFGQKKVVKEAEKGFKSGITIRISMDELRVMGRATQGVRLIKVGEGDEISSVEKISREEEELSESSDIVTDSTEITELPESPESPESPIESTE